VVIVDDGDRSSVGELSLVSVAQFLQLLCFFDTFLLRKSGVKYIRLKDQLSIGEKRNIATSHASGKIIAHWDDDDFFRNHRITHQVSKPHLYQNKEH